MLHDVVKISPERAKDIKKYIVFNINSYALSGLTFFYTLIYMFTGLHPVLIYYALSGLIFYTNLILN